MMIVDLSCSSEMFQKSRGGKVNTWAEGWPGRRRPERLKNAVEEEEKLAGLGREVSRGRG